MNSKYVIPIAFVITLTILFAFSLFGSLQDYKTEVSLEDNNTITAGTNKTNEIPNSKNENNDSEYKETKEQFLETAKPPQEPETHPQKTDTTTETPNAQSSHKTTVNISDKEYEKFIKETQKGHRAEFEEEADRHLEETLAKIDTQELEDLTKYYNGDEELAKETLENNRTRTIITEYEETVQHY